MTIVHFKKNAVNNRRHDPLHEKWQRVSDSSKNLLLSILFTIIAMGIIWLIFPPHFTETNDDMIMACFAYGYMGEYTDKLVFINILIGKLLKFCIQICPHVPWYALMQCSVVFASFSALTFLVLQKFGRKNALIPITFFYIFFGYEFFSSLQFTKTAAAAVTVGVLLIFYGVKKSRKWYTYLIGGLFTLIGSLYRFRIFEMLLLLLFGVGIVMVWKPLREKQWRKIGHICIPFVLVFGICFSAYVFDHWTYAHTKGWEDFWDYNYLRDNLQNSREDDEHTNGFPDYGENRDLYASLNITENDYNLYCTGNFADTELFTKEVIQTLVDAKHNKMINLQFIKSFVSTISKGIMSYSVFPAMCITLLAGILSCTRKKKEKLFLIFYELAAFAGIQFYFYYRGRYLQSRTDVSVIFSFVVILILCTVERELMQPTRKKTAALVAGACLFCIIPTYVGIQEKNRLDIVNHANTEIHSLISTDTSHFYLCFTNWGNFPDKMYDIWHVAEKGCGKNRSALGTWRVSTQTVIDKLSNYEITNPYRDMIDNPNIFLLCVNNDNLNQVLTHIHDHYNQDVYAYQVKSVENKYPVYRVVGGEPELDTSSAENILDNLHYDFNKSEEDETWNLNGYLYADNENSFASNIYIGVVNPDGTEKFYYTTQYKSDFTEDNMNGEYGTFFRKMPIPEEGSSLNLYLETEEKLYVVKNLDI